MTLEYFKATAADELQIRNILKKLNGDRSNFDISRFVVAKQGNELIGCVRIKVFEDGTLELSSLAVLPEHQGQGVGSQLVKKLLLNEVARPIFLLTSLDKESFYKKFSFNIIAPDKLSEEFKNSYLNIINLPFAKSLQVIAMVLK
jgi:N-acetylglutamate synthase-like GNAT family acetyltransferase